MFETLKQTVAVVRRVDSGEVDAFNRPVYAEESEEVDGVLVAPDFGGSADAASLGLRPDGDVVRYTLAFPKTYTDSLRNCWVEVDGLRLEVDGDPRPTPACPTDYDRIVYAEVLNG